jgi:hypothetical protein
MPQRAPVRRKSKKLRQHAHRRRSSDLPYTVWVPHRASNALHARSARFPKAPRRKSHRKRWLPRGTNPSWPQSTQAVCFMTTSGTKLPAASRALSAWPMKETQTLRVGRPGWSVPSKCLVYDSTGASAIKKKAHVGFGLVGLVGEAESPSPVPVWVNLHISRHGGVVAKGLHRSAQKRNAFSYLLCLI